MSQSYGKIVEDGLSMENFEDVPDIWKAVSEPIIWGLGLWDERRAVPVWAIVAMGVLVLVAEGALDDVSTTWIVDGIDSDASQSCFPDLP